MKWSFGLDLIYRSIGLFGRKWLNQGLTLEIVEKILKKKQNKRKYSKNKRICRFFRLP